MPIIKRQKVGGLNFIRVYALGRTWVFSYCETAKSHVLAA